MMVRSESFDDIYFSPDDGLAETNHVFLDGNHLPSRFPECDHFTIAETGFGTGLNFLAAWTVFEGTAKSGAILDYVSFELYPLSAADILSALTHWSAYFGGRLEKLVRSYPMRIPGWHRIDFGRVRLTLVFDDVNQALPRIGRQSGVDAWFLDGFAPAKNPLMWTESLFSEMARLSNPGATVATFTAAGIVKRGLAEAGFVVEKKPGYGRKRDMVTARFCLPATTGKTCVRPRSIAIIGGGLAGTACLSTLRARGYAPVLFESAGTLAAGASGNPHGIFNPRLSAHRTAESDFYAAAFAQTARLGEEPSCGSLHLITDDDKRKRFTQCAENWAWHPDHMRLVTAREASALCGIDIPHDALWLPQSGRLSPQGLCHDWAGDGDIRLSSRIAGDDLSEFDCVILACGAGVRDFVPDLPVHTVRGQIISARATPQTASLKTNLCFGGYIGAPMEDHHVIGSTFQKWLDTTEIIDQDTRDILDRLRDAVPGLDPGPVMGARAALRCSSHDRFPVIGPIPGKSGWYASTAHGSHGIVSSLAGATLLADMIDGTALSLPQDSVKALSAQRFPDRLARRAQAVI